MSAAERKADRPFDLNANSLGIWAFNWTDWPDDIPLQMKLWLPAGDRQQAERYKIAEDSTRFCVGRTMLRHLSARYLDVDARSLQLNLSDKGKPAWRDFSDLLHFNVSHSGAWVVIAFSKNNEVGIDVQKINTSPRFDCMKIAEYAFHPAEIEAVTAVPAEGRNLLFHRIWTCKEAVIKAVGEGLHSETRKFSVLPIPEDARSTPIEWSESRLSILKLEVDNSHTGAIAILNDFRNIKISRWGFADSGWPQPPS